VSSEERGYALECPKCGAPYHFTGFDVDEDTSITLFARCNELCDGDEEVRRVHISRETLEKFAERRRKDDDFIQMMEALSFPDPELTDGG
jgi:hypothetical protein